MDGKGGQAADPDIALTGLPLKDAVGKSMDDVVMDVVLQTIESLPKPRRRDPDVLGEAVRRAVRAAVLQVWGKKPICTVFVAALLGRHRRPPRTPPPFPRTTPFPSGPPPPECPPQQAWTPVP